MRKLKNEGLPQRLRPDPPWTPFLEAALPPPAQLACIGHPSRILVNSRYEVQVHEVKAVLYARVSTKDKDQDPEVQLRALRPWVTARGWTVTGEYTDKVTGDEARRRRDPPGLSQAMQQLEQHRAKVLAIYSAERLVRSPLGILRIVARVEQMGCHVASLQDGGDLDTTSDMGELHLFLHGWFARMNLRILRKSTIDGMEEARGRGVVLGRPPVVLPDPLQVQALRESGLGRTRIAAQLGVTPWEVRESLRLAGTSDARSDEPAPRVATTMTGDAE